MQSLVMATPKHASSPSHFSLMATLTHFTLICLSLLSPCLTKWKYKDTIMPMLWVHVHINVLLLDVLEVSLHWNMNKQARCGGALDYRKFDYSYQLAPPPFSKFKDVILEDRTFCDNKRTLAVIMSENAGLFLYALALRWAGSVSRV